MIVRKRRNPVGAEIDLTPVLSTIIHIIPIVLIAVRFVTMNEHVVDRAPIQASEAPSRQKLDEQDAERVVVRILGSGFAVHGAAEADTVIPCRAPCTPADYDYAQLSDAMVAARDRHPKTQQVIVAPAATVPYEVIIGVFDAATHRKAGGKIEPLFSDPVLVDGVSEASSAASTPATGSPGAATPFAPPSGVP